MQHTKMMYLNHALFMCRCSIVCLLWAVLLLEKSRAPVMAIKVNKSRTVTLNLCPTLQYSRVIHNVGT